MKIGEFTGFYSKENGKPYYFAGYDKVMAWNGKPCFLFATDLANKNTYARFRNDCLN